MFDRLEDLVIRYQEVMGELQEPDVANDPERFRKLMKEQSDLAPIVEAYQEYKNCKQNVEESLMILEEESDEEMRELAKEELNESKARIEELEQELKILLLPKDPNDDKNVIVEIRACAGVLTPVNAVPTKLFWVLQLMDTCATGTLCASAILSNVFNNSITLENTGSLKNG